MPDTVKATPKSEATRKRILDAALELFREQGFEAATMRGIAAQAGVALGGAYYYFDSKDAIVLAFYQQAQVDMMPRIEEVLAGSTDLRERLQRLIQVKLDYFAPSRRLFSALSGHTNPEHPLSPFSEQTKPIRDLDIAYFAQAAEGSSTKVPTDLRGYLPRLLWMYQMGIILFWINDRSPKQKRTQALLDRSLEIVTRLVKLAGVPLMRPVRKTVIELVDLVTEE